MCTSTIESEKLAAVRKFISDHRKKENPESYLIAVLHKVQELYRYLPEDVLQVVARDMKISLSHIWGVATFYHYFNLKPIGKHVISVCLGTACYVKGADKVLDAVKRNLDIQVGDTTADNLFTLQECRCLGTCGIAPVMMIDDKIYGELTPEDVAGIIRSYQGEPTK